MGSVGQSSLKRVERIPCVLAIRSEDLAVWVWTGCRLDRDLRELDSSKHMAEVPVLRKSYPFTCMGYIP